ncbi:D-arabinono-1,4-lactone oxidase [Jatrophihabitans sp. DSM 45814]
MSMGEPERNWAGTVTYRTTGLVAPTTLAELQERVAASPRIRALGSRHSFSDVADTSGELVAVRNLEHPVVIDESALTVEVGGGVRYGELATVLNDAGYALHNLGSLPHISVAGACATGTHGSGDANGNLPSAVRAIDFIRADGEAVRLSRAANPEEFAGAVVSMGALGVVTALTLAVVPAYQLRQDVYLDLPFETVVENLPEIFGAAYSVSLFTNWSRGFDQAWLKRRVDATTASTQAPTEFFSGSLATAAQHPILGQDPVSATQQLGVAGPWHERLPHFRLDFVPSNGHEIQTEYLLPRENAGAALVALRPLAARLAPLLMVSEFRTIAADDLWLSPSYQRDSFAVHFTWIADTERVRALLPAIEAALAPLDARPHWGKVFTIAPERVRAMYEHRADFAALAAEYDPAGKFSNEFLQTYVL